MIKRVFLMRGKERQEFLDYFSGLGGVSSEKDDNITLFKGNGWSAAIGPQTVYMLKILSFPEVEVTLEAEDEVFEVLLKGYRIKFLTAGG